MRWIKLLFAIALAATPSLSAGQTSNLPRDIQNLLQRGPATPVPNTGSKRLKYGNKYWQRIRFFPAEADGPAPLVAVLASPRNGWFRYRLVKAGISVAYLPRAEGYDHTEEYLRNYAEALAYLLDHGQELDLDPDRFIVAGYSSTARTAVLLGTSEEWLVGAGIPFGNLRGVIAHGGVGYASPKRNSEGELIDVKEEFKEDAIRFAPIEHLDSPNAPAFLFMAEIDDRDSRPDSEEIQDILSNAGIETQLVVLPDEVEQVTLSHFLVEPDGAGNELLPWVREQLASDD